MISDLPNNKGFDKIKKILHRKPIMIVVHITDTYFIEETKIKDDIDLPGFARFHSLIDFIKSDPIVKNNNISVIILHGGDFLFPSLMSLYFKGKQMIETLNSCGINYCTLGNHDFDGGIKYLKERMSEATFDIVCTNMKLTAKNTKSSLQIHDYVICQNKDNQPIAALVGIVGNATARKAKQNGFDVSPAKFSLKKTIATIRQHHPEIKHLIVLSHMSNQEDVYLQKWLDKNWNGYVYLLGGHDHNKILHYTNDENPKSVALKGESNCRTVQILGLHLNENPKDEKQFAKNILILESKILSKFNRNLKTQKIVKKWEKALEDHLNEKESDEIIKKFDGNTVLDATELSLRKGSTNFGNFIADCVLEFAKTDMAFINSGYFRGDRKIGNVLKLSDLRRIFVLDKIPALVKIVMTGAECKKFLKHAYSEEGRGKIMQISKNTIKILQDSAPEDRFTVTMLWDMIQTNDDRFATILASARKTTASKLQSQIKKNIIPKSSLFDVITKSSRHVRYDPKIRLSVDTISDYF